MAMWNPWRGCHKYSEGCKFCYIHKGDIRRGIDTNNIVKTDNFNAPVESNVYRKEFVLNLDNVELISSKMIKNSHLMSKIYAVRQERLILTVNNLYKRWKKLLFQ